MGTFSSFLLHSELYFSSCWPLIHELCLWGMGLLFYQFSVFVFFFNFPFLMYLIFYIPWCFLSLTSASSIFTSSGRWAGANWGRIFIVSPGRFTSIFFLAAFSASSLVFSSRCIFLNSPFFSCIHFLTRFWDSIVFSILSFINLFLSSGFFTFSSLICCLYRQSAKFQTRLRNHFSGDQMLMKDTTAHSVERSMPINFQGGDNWFNLLLSLYKVKGH